MMAFLEAVTLAPSNEKKKEGFGCSAEDGFDLHIPLLLVSWFLRGFTVIPPALTTCRHLR